MGRYLESDPVGIAGGVNTYAYVGSDPLTGKDPLGLINAVLQWGGAAYSGVGGEAAAGMYVTVSVKSPYVDARFYGTAGGGGGALAGGGLEGGLIKGNESNIEGVTFNVEGAAGPAGGSAMLDSHGHLVGVVGGPAAEAGFAVSATKTVAFGLNDLGPWMGGKLYDLLHKPCP